MAGISSKAAGKGLDCGCGNKKGYNGNEIQAKEFSDGSGLDVYDFNARTYDQQLGRFIQIDPEFENGQESLTPYHFGNDNPIKYDDPTGRCPSCVIGGVIGFVTDAVIQVSVSVSKSVLNGETPSLGTVWRDYSPTQALAATGAGAITGGISAYEQGAAALVKTAVVNATFNAGNQLVDKGSINPTEVVIAAVPVPEVKGGNVVNVRATERAVTQAQNRIDASTSSVPERKLTQLTNAKAADAQAKTINSTTKSTLSALREGSAKEGASTTYKSTSASAANTKTSFFIRPIQTPVSDNTRAIIRVRLP